MKFTVLALVAITASARHPMADQPSHILTITDEHSMSMRLKKRSSIRRKKLRSASTTLPQQNNDNLEYVGQLWMGENNEPVNVVWDTGSDWLVVASATDCEFCDGMDGGYDYSDEESFQAVPRSSKEIVYGSAYVSGFQANDLVCTTSESTSCAKMKWLVMTYGYGLDGIDGIAGMSTGLGYYSEGPLVV